MGDTLPASCWVAGVQEGMTSSSGMLKAFILLAIAMIATTDQGADWIVQEEPNTMVMESPVQEAAPVEQLVEVPPSKKGGSSKEAAMQKKVMKLLKEMMVKKEAKKAKQARLLQVKKHKEKAAKVKKQRQNRKKLAQKKKAQQKKKKLKVFRLKHGADLLHHLIQTNLQEAAKKEKTQGRRAAEIAKEKAHKLTAKKENKRRHLVSNVLSRAVNMFEGKEEIERKEKKEAERRNRHKERAVKEEEEAYAAQVSLEEDQEEMRMMGITVGHREKLDLSKPVSLGNKAQSLISNLIHVSHKPKKKVTKKVVKKAPRKKMAVKKVLKKKPKKKLKKSVHKIRGQTLIHIPHGGSSQKKSSRETKLHAKAVAKKSANLVDSVLQQALRLKISQTEKEEAAKAKKEAKREAMKDQLLAEEDDFSSEVEKEVSHEADHKVKIKKQRELELQAIIAKGREKKSKALAKHRVSKLVVKTRKQLHKDFSSKKDTARAYKKALAKSTGNDADATAAEMAASLFKTLGGHALDDPKKVGALVQSKVTKHFVAKKKNKMKKEEHEASMMAAKLFKKLGGDTSLVNKATLEHAIDKDVRHQLAKDEAKAPAVSKAPKKVVHKTKQASMKVKKVSAKMAKLAHKMAMDLKEASALYSTN